jgi:hypothetical protein
MGFVGYALASPPVPPPFEGFGISTFVDVVMDAGDFTENESFTWTWMDGPAGNNNTLAHPGAAQLLDAGGRAAQIRYNEELNSIDTDFFQFNKTFNAASHVATSGGPNLDVDKIYGWDDDETSLITSVSNSERIGLSIVANGDSRGLGDMPSLCPWTVGQTIPATNEFIAMGSDTAAGLGGVMLAETHTEVLATGPPRMDHTISAEGIGMAQGLMRLSLMEGDAAFNAPGGTVPDLISRTNYSETTRAAGVISTFVKGMHYDSVIPAYQMPEPWYQLQ